MSTGKRLKLEQKVDDRKWSNKVAREVIFPEIYERYGPNAEARMQLPAETLEELRRSIRNVLGNQPIIDETLRKNETTLEDYKDVLKKQGSIK
ncbi:hypothetical protein CTI12_AA236220 [Artemisia annua]|uniref:Uncharacterized protein n=1 Tax=Artemisia annua TaxID=35608 RepID=A0A2U1NRQ9_ARTAN|nr:hypothetical protein CTI12_AA236220 [Artemisia annua]